MKHLTKFLALGAFCTLLAGLTSCNEEPEYAQTVLTAPQKGTVMLAVGDTYSLVTIASEKNNMTWTSDKEDVATVSAEGLITAVGKGKAVISAQLGGETVASLNVQVFKSNCFVVLEKGKVVGTLPLDSCIDAWYLHRRLSETKGEYYHVLQPYSKTLASNGWGNLSYKETEAGIKLEIPLLLEHNLQDMDDYTPLKAGTYSIMTGWDFDFIYRYTEMDHNDTWTYAWPYDGTSPKIPFELKKDGSTYSFSYSGTDEFGRSIFFSYKGKIVGQYWD
ncbi:MAG: Ig-like domain-containing protein [Paludibacteraceae bacterium]|nr:Ig-like domain-containing protein [Paludibacteraceae bacterium]